MYKKILLILFTLLFMSICQVGQAKSDRFIKEMLIAEELLNQSKEQQAIAVYEALILKDASYAPAYTALATIYARRSEFVKAEKLLLKILNSNKKNASAYERLAYTYYLWADANKESQDHLLKKALEAMEKAVKLDKYNAQIYATYGLILGELGKYDQAYNCYEKALNINPSNQATYTNLGILYTKLEKYDLALANFQKAIGLDTTTPRPYRELAKMLSITNQDRQAIEYLQNARFYDIFTTYQDHYLMATLQEKMGNLKEAINEFVDTLALKPDFIDCYTHIARIAEALQDDEMAIEYYKKAVALDYSILESFIKTARSYLVESDFMRARPLYIKILQIEPGNRYAFEGLCSMHYLMAVEGKLNFQHWYIDQEFLRNQLPEFKEYTNLLDVSWVKFDIAKNGLTSENKQKLIDLMNLSTNTPEDYSARGEALFLYKNYTEADQVLNEAIDKYVSHYTQGDSYDEASKQLVWAADRLYTYHEFFASKNTYDKAIELQDLKNAIDGLTYLSNSMNNAENLLDNVLFVPESPGYHNEVINRLTNVIRLYPQSTKAHYMLSIQCAITGDFENAINELIIYKNLYHINPYKNGPNLKKVDKLMEKYYKIINARQKKEVLTQ